MGPSANSSPGGWEITLLKKGKCFERDVDYYRPIIFLNTQLIIFAKILLERLKSVPETLLRPEQTWCEGK